MARTYVALDLETTGLSPRLDRMIEAGAVRFRDGEVGPRVLIDGHTGEQQLCEFSPPLRRPAPVPDDLEARQNRQSGGDVMRLFLEARAGMAQPLPKLPLGGLVQ